MKKGGVVHVGAGDLVGLGPMSLRALQYLGSVGSASADEVGTHVWAGKKRGKTTSNGGGGDYAAQMLLGRLRAAGLVERAPGKCSTQWGITLRGRRVTKEVI